MQDNTVITLRIGTISEDSDHILQNTASDQDLHCLPLIQQFFIHFTSTVTQLTEHLLCDLEVVDSIHGGVIPKSLKILVVLAAFLLGTQH